MNNELSQEEINAFKEHGCSFEEIESIKRGLEDIENGNVYTEEQVDDYINNTLFAKYKAYV